MTALENRLQEDMKEAMKAGDRTALATIRLLRSQIQYAKMQAGDAWSEEGANDTVNSAAKMRRESISQFVQGGRDDLVAKEQAELAVIERYLPAQLAEHELDAFVTAAIAEVGASGPKDIGKVMSAVMPKVRGRADGKAITSLVREKLATI
jgi:hypothetical protein